MWCRICEKKKSTITQLSWGAEKYSAIISSVEVVFVVLKSYRRSPYFPPSLDCLDFACLATEAEKNDYVYLVASDAGLQYRGGRVGRGIWNQNHTTSDRHSFFGAASSTATRKEMGASRKIFEEGERKGKEQEEWKNEKMRNITWR